MDGAIGLTPLSLCPHSNYRESFTNNLNNKCIMKKNNLINLIILCSIFVISCNKENGFDVEYIPFQESENGMWGMISPDGEVLFSEEFKKEPTCVKDGLFMVKNDDDLWEIYTAESKPRKVGDEYLYASYFYGGRAFVVKRNGYITIIDKKGKEIRTLDKIGKKPVDYVDSFSEGYAVYSSGGYVGAIDYDGKEIVKSDYLFLSPCFEGKFIGINKKYEAEYKDKSKSEYSFDIIDTDGKVLFSLSKNKYSNIGLRFHDGLLPVAVKIEGEECWGLINDKNEVVVKPSTKIKNIGEIKGDNFIYSNGEGVGLMNINGEVLIRAKYENLGFEKSNRLFAVTEDKCRLIDNDDNRIGDEEYLTFYSSTIFKGEHAFVKISDKMWSIIDFDGNQLKKLPDIINLGTSVGDNRIKNDHIDFFALFSDLKLSVNSVDEITLQKTTPKELAELREKYCYEGGTDDHPLSDPYWYDYVQQQSFPKTFNEIGVLIIAAFPSAMSRIVYRTEYEDYGYFTYSHEVPSGYKFNNVFANCLGIVFVDSGKLKGKQKLLFNALNDYVKRLGGKFAKGNDNASVYTYNEDNRVYITNDGNSVCMTWGNLRSVDELDIEQYKNISDDSALMADSLDVCVDSIW